MNKCRILFLIYPYPKGDFRCLQALTILGAWVPFSGLGMKNTTIKSSHYLIGFYSVKIKPDKIFKKNITKSYFSELIIKKTFWHIYTEVPPQRNNREDNKQIIEVANLWPNSLIGNELEPDDEVKNGKWPDWLRNSTQLPTKLYTFTTYRYYKKNPLMGLFRVLGISME